MGRLIVIQFTTLDGVVTDPDGGDGTEHGGWAMRHGPQGVAGDKFRLGPLLHSATMLYGRRTWEHFSGMWPHRDDDFSKVMNAATKAVATHHPLDETRWQNSRAITEPLTDWVTATLETTDIVVLGSESIVTALADADLVDEYRLLIFPSAIGAGDRLFHQRHLRVVSAEQVGPGVLVVLEPERPGRDLSARRTARR